MNSSSPPTLPQVKARDGQTAIERLSHLLLGKSAQQGYLSAIDQAVISLTNFIATLILARSVSPTELGVYGVGFTSLRLARALQDGLITQPLNAFGAAMDEDGFKKYGTHNTVLQIILATTSALGALLLGWLLTATGNDTAGPGVLALWAPLLGWQLSEYLRRVFYARQRIPAALANTLLSNLARLGLLLFWLYNGGLSGARGLYAIGFGSFPALLLGFWQTRSYWRGKPQGIRGTFLHNWRFGSWIIGGSLANWVTVEFYPVLTAGMLSFAAAGAYRALQNLVAPIHMLLRAVDTFLTPRAASDYQHNGKAALLRSMRLVYLLTGIPILGTLLIAVLLRAPLLELLYGETYLPYQDGVILMALFYAFWFAYWPLQSAFKATQNSRPLFNANLIAILVMFTAGVWMISRWGVFGTIAGQALNALVVAAILWGAWLGVKRDKL